MSDCIKVEIDADRGTTVKSPNFFSIEEIVIPGTTIADIEAGILDGTYTPIDPNLYTYVGQVKSDYNKTVIVNLNLIIETVTIEGTVTGSGTDTYEVVTFKILPADTIVWDNREHKYFFDIKRTEVAAPNDVDIWVKGTINVLPVITE